MFPSMLNIKKEHLWCMQPPVICSGDFESGDIGHKSCCPHSEREAPATHSESGGHCRPFQGKLIRD